MLVSLLAQLAQASNMINKDGNIRLIAKEPRSNFSLQTREELFRHFAQIDVDVIITQFISGSFRTFEGRKLLFPYYDGELARDVVSQTAKALGAEDAGTMQKTAVWFGRKRAREYCRDPLRKLRVSGGFGGERSLVRLCKDSDV
jgi:hypothetical protein